MIGVMTALQESHLINSAAMTDHDSVGLFQQRPSMGWGTVEQLMNPSYAARAFFARELGLAGREGMPEWQVAATVQRPDARYATFYQQWKDQALAMVTASNVYGPTPAAAAAAAHPAGAGAPGHRGVFDQGGWLAKGVTNARPPPQQDAGGVAVDTTAGGGGGSAGPEPEAT